ncbi:ABC transporter permease [Acuticoccus sediminis]|uniref:ABC transporter permease n=1 Tax=Acuticoccus sediminis TaxID=2184697 RepID=UPI001CFEA134|nr:ABC transporter permease [Acuticoccus sediminis]
MTAVDGPATVAARGQRRRRDWSDAVLGAYLLVFFAFMFAPLLIMVGAAFNDYPTPSITEWRGFTLRWFIELPQDARMMQGLWNSLMVAAGVLAIAIPLGLSGALVLSRLSSRATGLLYAILVSPMLTPGIILGITTMIFWRDLFGVQAGLFTAMVAQASFISSYVLLMFMARLSRQDRTLEEAAADLGASPFFTFRRITLPFLMPTIGTAALIALLQSIENYNTTFFAIGPDWTLVTEIGSRMRFGLSPIINAVGVIFITITVIAAATWALLRTRTAR